MKSITKGYDPVPNGLTVARNKEYKKQKRYPTTRVSFFNWNRDGSKAIETKWVGVIKTGGERNKGKVKTTILRDESVKRMGRKGDTRRDVTRCRNVQMKINAPD